MKKGYWYTLIAIAVILILSFTLVYATGYATNQPSHDKLYTNTIRSRDSSTVIVDDKFTIKPNGANPKDIVVDVQRNTASITSKRDTADPAVNIESTDANNRQALQVFGWSYLISPAKTALFVRVNETSSNVLEGSYFTGSMMGTNPERSVTLANNTYAVYGSTDTGYIGWFAGLDPFAVGTVAVGGLASAIKGGSIGSLNYGVYG